MVARILEISFVLVFLYLVLMHATEFGTATSSIAQAYTGAVKTLQGRG